jgi:hypothetical protein
MWFFGHIRNNAFLGLKREARLSGGRDRVKPFSRLMNEGRD